MNTEMKKLFDSGNWMIRFDDNGISYKEFKWNPVGEWTEAPDWNTKEECQGGLFGQDNISCGYCKVGATMVLCEYDPSDIVRLQNKLKVKRAKRVAENEKIPPEFLNAFKGNLWMNCYKHALPEGFAHCDGSLCLSGYSHALPAGFSHCGRDLYLNGYAHALPEGFTHCDGSLCLSGYSHALPEGFAHCDGSLYLNGYAHALPAGFSHCGGYLDLRGYAHALPTGFTHCGGYLGLGEYKHALPTGCV